MYNIEINKKEISVSKNLTILQAIEKIGIKVPRFCFHEKLSIAGNCRICLIEVEKINKPVASCAILVNDNMQIFTNSILVKKARESVLELLLINHPLDCPICDQGGECDLQDQTLFFGNDRSRFYDIKRSVSDKNISPIIKTIMTRCIHCTRCVRFLNEVSGITELGVTGRGNNMEISTYIENTIDSEISGNIIDLCPVGALTSKSYAFIARSWELKSIETIDILDSLGSNIIIHTRGCTIMRVLPKINENLNEEWITDKIRFCLDGNNYQRLHLPYYQLKNYFVFVYNNLKIIEKNNFSLFIKIICSWNLAFLIYKEQFFFKYFNNKHIIVGNHLNIESLSLLKKMYYIFNFHNLNYQYNNFIKNNLDFQYNYHLNLLPKNLENIDVCLLIGINLRLENPLLNSRLKKSLNNNSIIASIGPNINSIFSLKKLGNSIKTIINIINGKHKFNFFLNNGKNPIIILSNNLNYLFNNVKKFIKNSNLKVLNIYSYISCLSIYEFGIKSLNFIKNINTFYYLVESDEIFLNNENNNYIVYQGSHLDRNALIADLIFPSHTYLEENGSYLNINGNIVNTNKVLDLLPINSFKNRNSFNIIKSLLYYLLNLKIDKFILNIINNINNKIFYKNIDFFFNINNFFYNNLIFNYYKTDTLSRSSLIMSKIIQYNNNKLNYL